MINYLLTVFKGMKLVIGKVPEEDTIKNEYYRLVEFRGNKIWNFPLGLAFYEPVYVSYM